MQDRSAAGRQTRLAASRLFGRRRVRLLNLLWRVRLPKLLYRARRLLRRVRLLNLPWRVPMQL